MSRTTLVPCPDCEGSSVRPADRGGIAKGGCLTCGGTGLVPEEEA